MIHKIVQEIREKSDGGDYIFRGEPKKFPQVSSTLYRKYSKIKNLVIDTVDMDITGKAVDATDIEIIQDHLLRYAMDHDLNDSAKSKKNEIQTKVQHWGGATNLIDFTEDYRIALFFACSRDYDSDGRIILQNREKVQNLICVPQEPKHRVDSQKSVFVSPPKGFIEVDANLIVKIPKCLKIPVLKWLSSPDSEITDETIYRDLHGFIKFEDRYLRATTRFHQAYNFEVMAKNTENHTQRDALLQKAVKYYEKLVEEMPNHRNAHFRCGILYGMLGKLENATYFAKEATEWEVDHFESFGLLGKCFFDSRNFEMAIENFSYSIRLNENYVEGYVSRGDAYSFCNNNKLAIKDYSKAIEIEPDNHRPYVNRGMVYLEERKPDLAINDCTKALQLKPDNYYAFINRGNAYLQKCEFELAIEDFNAVIELNSGKFPVFACRGYAYLKKGDYDRSANDFHKALELEPNYHIAHLYLGKIYEHKGELSQAEIYYSKLIDIDHDVDASNYHLFIVPNGKTKVFHKQDREAEGYICRAAVYLRMQQWEKARMDIVATQGTKVKSDWFKNIHGSVEGFEKKYGMKIPKDLVELLSHSPS